MTTLAQSVCLVIIVFTLLSHGPPDPGYVRQVAARLQIDSFLAALGNYKRDIGEFPTELEGLQALRSDPGARGWRGPYRSANIPQDPWGRPYLFRIKVDRQPEVLSMGADHKAGGEDANADVSNLIPAAPYRRVWLPYIRLVIFAAACAGLRFLPRLLRRLLSLGQA